LIEVVVSLMLFAMAMAGIFSLIFQSYATATRTRLIDESRSVMRTVTDEFMRLSAEDVATKQLLTMFTPTTGPTGTGLIFDGVAGNAQYLPVTLGKAAGVPVEARLTRHVVNLDSSGGPITSTSPSAAGHLVQGQFTISLTVGNRVLEESVVLVRSIP
jgi:type II secretory pathway pseudopilin PulG